MRTYTYTYKIGLILLSFLVWHNSIAQKDSAYRVKILPTDTSTQKLNMDAVYNRPFLLNKKSNLAIGGYLEANSQFSQTDGVNEGLSFQARRFTLFLSSTIADRIKFFSEIEFEGGTQEINIEFAAVDVELHSLLNLRAGIVMNPIGAFNQNHDGPKWDFVDRPLSATAIIPTTYSNAGFGLHGKHFSGSWVIGYEAYVTNGFDDKIISNSENRTSLGASKENAERFMVNSSGNAMYTGKLAVRRRHLGEMGISYMTGVYNTWKSDGIVFDKQRFANVFAVDLQTSLWKNRISITAEMVKVMVDIPENYIPTFGSRQFGGYTDIVTTIIQKPILKWKNAKINAGIRLEYVDLNGDIFDGTGSKIGDHIYGLVPSIAFRPTGGTVFRINYSHQLHTDLLGNPPAKTGTIQVGLSSYF